MKAFRVAAILGLIALGCAWPALAWDNGGHELIATMACDRLNPKALQAVTDLAHEMNSAGLSYDAVTIACWMDDLRKNETMPNHGLFLSWHYIDIGLSPSDPRPSFEPGNDNEMHGDVVQALKRAMVVLQGGTDPYVKSKAMACALVMHLVGDIHQPLHCATKYFFSGGHLHQDAGGNKEDVLNGPPGEAGKFNLHAFWDAAYRASFDDASGKVALDLPSIPALAKILEQQPPPPDADLETHFDRWAWESNKVARDFVYRQLTATDNKKYCRLSSGYVAQASTLARQRLVLAAWRLATLLNQTLGADAPIQPPSSYPAGPPSY
jgi:hypothetical protein